MLDVVIVGAGQAGLAMSHELAGRGVEHVVLEAGRVGETWRSQRWDSFQLNTPGSLSGLPGDEHGVGPSDGFASRDAVVGYFDDYAIRHSLPIRTGVTVTSVAAVGGGNGFDVRGEGIEPLMARTVVVTAGGQRVPRVPAFATDLPATVTQVHSTAYRHPSHLPSGAVLVVGSAQSGAQIAEDLLDAGREVFLSTSRLARMRRRYRGRDTMDWLRAAGFLDRTVADLPDPALEFAPQPVISGVGPFGHSVSIQWLGERGIHLLGHATGVEGGRLVLADDLGSNVSRGDAGSAEIIGQIERHIAQRGLDAAEREDDPGDAPHPAPESLHAPTSLDLDAAGISAVVWTTGVRGDWSWLPPIVVGADGRPIHVAGASSIEGLFFIGLPWLRTAASGILPGVGPDAAFLAEQISARLTGA